jgi:hypothetical protein
MYRKTTIHTLPEGSTATHWQYPTHHCDRFETEHPEERLFGERTFSEDGRVWTTTQIWVSKEAWSNFANSERSVQVREEKRAYCNAHGIIITNEEEEF